MAGELEAKIKASLVEGKLPCAVAFSVAQNLNINPRMVGDKANELKVRIINCQLGCFDVEKATHSDLENIPIITEVQDKIQTSLVNNKLPCSIAFQIAGELKVGRRQVGDTTTKLNIKIATCQLGCFP
jgi:hypothetical protein